MLAMAALLLSAFACFAGALAAPIQDRSVPAEDQAREQFEKFEAAGQLRNFRHAGIAGRKMPARQVAPQFLEMADRAALVSRRSDFAPGDTPLFIAEASRPYSNGEPCQIDLLATQNWDSPVIVYGRVFRPGENGEYDGSVPVRYFVPRLAGRPYQLDQVKVWDRFDVYTLPFPADSQQGRYIVDITIASVANGTLVQQILLDVYYIKTSGYGRGQLFFDHVELTGSASDGYGYLLHGGFQVGGEHIVYFGQRLGGVIGYDFQSNDGKVMNIKYAWSLPEGRHAPLNFVVHNILLRQSWTIPAAIIMPPSK